MKKVRFTTDGVGMIRKDAPRPAFTDDVLGKGDTGTIIEGMNLPDGWIAVEPDGFPDCYAPVHPDMTEEV